MFDMIQAVMWLRHMAIILLLCMMFPILRDMYWSMCERVDFTKKEWISFIFLKTSSYGLPAFIVWYTFMTWNDFLLVPQSQMIILFVSISLTIMYYSRMQTAWDERFRYYMRNREMTNERLRRKDTKNDG